MSIKNHQTQFIKLLLVLAVSFSIVFCCGCGTLTSTNITAPATSPVFTNPVVKLAQVQNAGFTTQLYNEALSLRPELKYNGVQVHMGYWSGTGNRTALVQLLNSINSSHTGFDLAIWDEGIDTSAGHQYSDYVTMNLEYWYERAYAGTSPVIINGSSYTDPYPVTVQQANDIWGGYSQRYADMAANFYLITGKPAKARCFVQGAYANRVFYTYELPELRILEAAGSVIVYFAKTAGADWRNSGDWTVGTANAPTPLARTLMQVRNIYDR